MKADFSLNGLFGVEGQRVIITGGGTGIGRYLAKAFATNGAKVYITGRRSDVLETTAKELTDEIQGKGQVVPVQGDVSSKIKCKELYERIAKVEDRIDTLINCAGVLRQWNAKGKDFSKPDEAQELLESVTDEDFSFTNSINISGIFFTTVAFLPLLRKSDKANVINISSIAAFHISRKGGPVTYGVSKIGAVNVSQHLAGRLAEMKIRVNVIAPGIFPSEMTAMDESKLPEVVRVNLPLIPVGRMGTPREIAGPCIMLASAAGGYMNNSCLVVDGGRLMTVSIL